MFRTIIFVIGLLVLLVGLGSFFFKRTVKTPVLDRYKNPTGEYNTHVERAPRPTSAAVTVFGLLLSLASCFFVVGGTEVAIPVTAGKPGAELSSGIQFKAPWTKLVRFDKNYVTIQFEGEGNGPTDEIQVATKDNGVLFIDAALRFTIDFDEEGCSVKKLYSIVRSQDRLEQTLIISDFRKLTRDVYKDFGSTTFTVDRVSANDAMRAAATTQLAKYCVKVDDVLLRGIRPSEQVQNQINASLSAAQSIATKKAEAEAKRQEAQGTADAAVIAAEGKLEAARKESAANDLLQESLTPEILRLKYIEALRESQNRIIITDGDSDTGTIIDTRP